MAQTKKPSHIGGAAIGSASSTISGPAQASSPTRSRSRRTSCAASPGISPIERRLRVLEVAVVGVDGHVLRCRPRGIEDDDARVGRRIGLRHERERDPAPV
jgi:hypothetical protein